MKKILILVLAIMLFTGVYAQAGQLGLGLTKGADIDDIGLYVGYQFGLAPKINLGPDMTYYLTSSGLTYFEINFNLFYSFVADGNLSVYGLAGLQFAYASIDLGFLGSSSNSEIGINLGLGIQINLGGASLFLEPKFTINGFEQLAFSGGVRFKL